MGKNKLLKWLLPCCIGLSISSQALAHTVQEAVAHALKTGPDILISANSREAIEEELREAFAGYLPTIDLNAGWGREKSENSSTRIPGQTDGSRTLWRTEFGINARQMLFDGFAVKNDVEGNMARVRAASWRVNNDASEIALDVITAFLEINLEKELVHLARQNLNAHQGTFGQIERRSESGIGRRADLDQATGRLAFARTNLLAEQANLRDAETRFLRLVGIPPIELVQPESPTVGFPETLRSAIALGVNYHPELRAAVTDVSVARAAHRAAKAPFYPRLDFELGFNRNHNIDGVTGDNDDFFGMLRLRWNLFRGGADLARTKATAWQIEEAKEVRNRAHRQVEESVRLAWSTYVTASSQIHYFRQHVESSLSTRDAYEKQFNIGQRTLLDLLDSENELFTARTAYANGKHLEILGKFRVLQATGCLLDYLGVPLPRAARIEEPTLFGFNYGKPAHYYDQYNRTNYYSDAYYGAPTNTTYTVDEHHVDFGE
ncbi:MAG TPA: TolC family outer membrane protein, partial [Gammaproteobacteria bacterium]|nr:TolC family outer membrane protein [Gammaproteobacteria bacterium]